MQRVRTVERIANRSIIVETTYVPVWDGTEACGGRLLGDYTPPPPVKAKPFLVLDEPDPQARPRPVRLSRSEAQRRVWARPNHKRRVPTPVLGPVYHARPAIWARLASPVTVEEVSLALPSLPRRGIAAGIAMLVHTGAVVRVGLRANVVRRPGLQHFSVVYQRAPQFMDAAEWPVLPRPKRKGATPCTLVEKAS